MLTFVLPKRREEIISAVCSGILEWFFLNEERRGKNEELGKACANLVRGEKENPVWWGGKERG